MFRKPFPAYVPPERLKAQALQAWAGEVFSQLRPVVYANVLPTRPEGTTDREAQYALRREADRLGCKVTRQRHATGTSSVARFP